MKHTILVKNKNRKHTCIETKNLMDGLNVYANLVPKGCHNGACGVCKIHVLKGEYCSKGKMNRKHITEEEEKNNIVLACRVFPKGDMDIEFIPRTIPSIKKKVYVLGN
ncbi:MAG: 2Fe-2S iron-sulfur cluster-binding protein [Halarcobacter sp.]